MQQNLQLPDDRAPFSSGPRISRATVARLHSLGNFEHVRYEVTVELPPGTSPSSVIRDLDDMLANLAPKPPISEYERYRSEQELAKPEPTLEAIKAKRAAAGGDDVHFTSAETDLESALSARQNYRDRITMYEAWRTSREKAMARFDTMGGQARHGGGRDGD